MEQMLGWIRFIVVWIVVIIGVVYSVQYIYEIIYPISESQSSNSTIIRNPYIIEYSKNSEPDLNQSNNITVNKHGATIKSVRVI